MASFHVRCLLLTMMIFNDVSAFIKLPKQLPKPAPPPQMSNANGDGFNDCMRFGMCKCEDYDSWQECWDTLMPESKKQVLKGLRSEEACKDIDSSKVGEDAQFMDLMHMMCNSDSAKWIPCYKRINTFMSEYVAQVSEALTKRKESEKIELARGCVLPVVSSRCSTMMFGECPPKDLWRRRK